MSRLFLDRPNVQRVVHYQGHRPFRAFLIIMAGYLIGYYAGSHDCRPAVQLTESHR